MKIVIKKISEKTLDEFYDFFQKSLQPLFSEYNPRDLDFIINKGWTRKRYGKRLKDKSKILFGAWVDGKLVGIMDTDAPFIGVSFGIWLMVDQKHQGHGVGSKLIEKFEEVSKKLGAHSVYLYSGDTKVDFYKHRGYELVGVHRKAWFGHDHFYFAKQIAEPKQENYLKYKK